MFNEGEGVCVIFIFILFFVQTHIGDFYCVLVVAEIFKILNMFSLVLRSWFIHIHTNSPHIKCSCISTWIQEICIPLSLLSPSCLFSSIFLPPANLHISRLILILYISLHSKLPGRFLSFSSSVYDRITLTSQPLKATWGNTRRTHIETHTLIYITEVGCNLCQLYAENNKQHLSIWFKEMHVMATIPVGKHTVLPSCPWKLLRVIYFIMEDKWLEREIYKIPIKETDSVRLAVKRKWHKRSLAAWLPQC